MSQRDSSRLGRRTMCSVAAMSCSSAVLSRRRWAIWRFSPAMSRCRTPSAAACCVSEVEGPFSPGGRRLDGGEVAELLSGGGEAASRSGRDVQPAGCPFGQGAASVGQGQLTASHLPQELHLFGPDPANDVLGSDQPSLDFVRCAINQSSSSHIITVSIRCDRIRPHNRGLEGVVFLLRSTDSGPIGG